MRRADSSTEPLRLSAALLLLAGCGEAAAPAPVVEPPGVVVESLPPPRTLAAGDGFTCAIRDEGRVRCWGSGTDETRCGSLTPREMLDLDLEGLERGPRAVEGLGPAIELAASDDSVCARHADGAVSCATNPHRGGVAAEVAVLRGATRIGAARWLRCGIVSGALVCVDTTGRTLAPDGVPAAPVELWSIRSSICVGSATGDAVCVRSRSADGTSIDVAVVPASAGAIAIGPGPCVADATGSRCAGPGYVTPIPMEAVTAASDVRAVGRTSSALWEVRGRALFARDDGGSFRDVGLALDEIAFGSCHVCGRVGATISCLGDNAGGALDGLGPSPASPPTRVLGVEHAIDVASTEAGACALLEGGALRCWRRADASAIALTAPSGWTDLVATPSAVCGRTVTGEVGCLDVATLAPPMPVALDATRALVGSTRSRDLCAQDGNGDVRCAALADGRVRDVDALDGAEDLGLLPLELCGRLDGRVVCVPHAGGPVRRLRRAERFFAGGDQAFVLDGGQLWAWGSCFRGELGFAPPAGMTDRCPGESCPDGVESIDTPRRVPAWPAPIAMAIGDGASCAWAEGTPIYCAGFRHDLTLAIGYEDGVDGRIQAIPLVDGPRVVSVARTSCAVDREGAVWCWGLGHRGDGRTAVADTPLTVDFD